VEHGFFQHSVKPHWVTGQPFILQYFYKTQDPFDLWGNPICISYDDLNTIQVLVFTNASSLNVQATTAPVYVAYSTFSDSWWILYVTTAPQGSGVGGPLSSSLLRSQIF
jgi:hypothetical protein